MPCWTSSVLADGLGNGVRFRPNAIGYWRLLINYAVGTQISAQDYDVTPLPPTVDTGLKASFVKPKC